MDFIRCAALILLTTLVGAQDWTIQDNKPLFDLLVKHQDSQFPHGTTFPSEVLECTFYENAAIDHIIFDDNGDPEFLFTSVRTAVASYFLYPNILSKNASGEWKRTPIPTTGDGWTHIHQSKSGEQILILMDNRPGSAGWETRFVLSEDGGRSWAYVSEIRKYIYFDVISYFTMSEHGHGVAIEYYDGDVSGYEDAGYYVFKTADWGRNWTDREYWTEYDTSGFVNVIDGLVQRRANRRPLSDLELAGFRGCANGRENA